MGWEFILSSTNKLNKIAINTYYQGGNFSITFVRVGEIRINLSRRAGMV